MDHFYQNITGWFDFQNIYSDEVRRAKDGSHFVEIGCYYGKSTSFMAVEIINSGKNITFDCVDCWVMSKFEDFVKNIQPVWKTINILKKQSYAASQDYDDHSLDFVFIDADHTFEFVLNDIIAWYPKVKVGGTLAGHDYHPNHPGVIKAVDMLLPQSEKTVTSWRITKTKFGKL